MVDFCIEPEKCCHKDPIRELDLKVDQYYSSIYSRLCKHVNDTIVHITQEERDEWNNKASKEALKDIQDQLNEITGDGDGSIKQEILLEVTKQIADAIDSLHLDDYAKKKYVDDAIKNIKLDGYITKSYADSTYLKIVDYTKFDANSYYTKAEIQNMLKNSNIGKDYSIESFTIEDNKLVLTQKNGGQFKISLPEAGIGGVDASYVQEQLKGYIKKNTLAKLRINNNILTLENGGTITIPVGGNNQVDPTKFGYYKSYFKETSNKVTSVSAPANNRPPEEGSGWVENSPNYRDGYLIWMTQVFINGNGQYGEYINPICLTGSGTAGEDGSGVNFIYKTAIEGENVSSPGNVSVQDGVPVVPSGWTNHPSGVTKEVPYEYCSVATNTKGQWNPQWSQPFVWSHFGQNGMDGDGVEYIYYASTLAPTNNLPSTWTSDENFQDREYIRANSGWTDDPTDLEKLGPGYKQWVCVRKKYADAGSKDTYWHAYSDPALWGNYARDGVVSGIIIDVAGEIKYLYVDDNYSNFEYSGESTITMYDDDSPVQFDLTIDSVKGSDGSYLSTQDINNYFSVTNSGSSKVLNIDIPAYKLNFASNTYYIINVVGTPKSSSISSQKRTAQIQMYGIKQGGQNGVSYDLKISAAAINKQDGALYPKSVNVKVMKGDGPNITEIGPNNYEGWSFKYSINDGDSYKDIDSNPVSTEGDNGMLFTATNGTITLREFVPIVKSSVVAGLNGVSYSLQMSNLQLTYKPQNSAYSFHISGTIQLYRIEAGGSSTEITNDDAKIKYQLSSDSSKTELTYQSGGWRLDVSKTLSSSSDVITLYAYNTNGVYLTSMSVPVSASGEKGDKGDKGDTGEGSTGQTYNGSPLRMSREIDGQITTAWKKGFKYYDGKRDAENGIFYQDVVLYNNMYYVCINTDTGEENHWQLAPDVAGYWSKFAVTENFVADKIIANQAYIKELSSEEVVIMDNGEIVAGMTSSKAVDSNSDLNGKVTNKGDVRIWAGRVSNADLTTAPFTVTNTGEIKSQGEENSVTIKNGKIVFNFGSHGEWYVGWDDSKNCPNWLGGQGSESKTFYTFQGSSQSITQSSKTKYCYNGIWYDDSRLETKTNGVYSIKLDSRVPVKVGSTPLIGTVAPFVELYAQFNFSDGKPTVDGIFGVGYIASLKDVSGISGVTPGKYYYKINTTKYYYDVEFMSKASMEGKKYLVSYQQITDPSDNGKIWECNMISYSDIVFGQDVSQICILNRSNEKNVTQSDAYTLSIFKGSPSNSDFKLYITNKNIDGTI